MKLKGKRIFTEFGAKPALNTPLSVTRPCAFRALCDLFGASTRVPHVLFTLQRVLPSLDGMGARALRCVPVRSGLSASLSVVMLPFCQ